MNPTVRIPCCIHSKPLLRLKVERLLSVSRACTIAHAPPPQQMHAPPWIMTYAMIFGCALDCVVLIGFVDKRVVGG